MGVERTVLRPMIGKPVFVISIITLGVDIVIRVVVNAYIGLDVRPVGAPWGLATSRLLGIEVQQRHLIMFVTTMVLVAILFAFFRYSRMGLAMRAVAFDQEVALAQGVSVGLVFTLSWAIAGALATVAGVFVSTGAGVDQQLWLIALKALPVIILGGLDSLGGAVIAGLAIGVVESLVATYGPDMAPWLGGEFALVTPYLVMMVVLLVRPYGLFGTREVDADMTSMRTRFGRPELYTSYEQDMALLNTMSKKVFVGVVLVLALAMTFSVDDGLLQLLATGCAAAIGAIGLNIVTGYAGQVSLGHAFFVGHRRVHRRSAVRRPERPVARLRHHRGAGLVAGRRGGCPRWPARWSRRWPCACAGCTWRSSRSAWSSSGSTCFASGRRWPAPPDIGRPAPVATLFGARIDVDGAVDDPRPAAVSADARTLVIFAAAGPQPRRSRTGRAFAAIRDRTSPPR